jgi:hypothetical protein
MPCIHCGEIHPVALDRTMTICRNCQQANNPKRRHGICSNCGHWRPIDIHHVNGRAVSNETVPLCVNCHRKHHSRLNFRCAHKPN